MSRKSLVLAIAVVLFLLGSAGAVLYLLVRYQPAFYVRSNVPPGEHRKSLSGVRVALLETQARADVEESGNSDCGVEQELRELLTCSRGENL